MRIAVALLVLAVAGGASAGTWEQFFPEPDTLLAFRLGDTKASVVASADLQVLGLKCEADGQWETCAVNTSGRDWRRLRPASTGRDELAVIFRDGRLVGMLYMVMFDEYGPAEKTYYEARAALTLANGKQGKEHGAFKRRLFGMIAPEGKTESAIEWGGDRRTFVWLLRVARTSGAVTVVIGEQR